MVKSPRILPLLLLLSLIPQAHAADGDYCVAIRGNGELAPAHWAGLSRMVEEKGMPKTMAGGSSATVTMFFADSIAGNPAITAVTDPEKKRKMQGLLLKSLPQFMATMGKEEKVLDAYALMNELGNKDSPLVDKVKKAIASGGNAEDIKRAFGRFGPLVNPDMLRGLAVKPDFFKKESSNALAVFGKFDAKTDANLFLRPGIVDFKAFAVIMGNVADFYAGNTDQATQAALAKFTEECAEASYKKEWNDIPADACKKKFEEIAGSYIKKGQFQNKALFQSVGKNVESIPTTAIVSGNGFTRFKDYQASYNSGDTSRDYSKFNVDFDRELSFGYWGNQQQLARIDRGLEPMRRQGDLKSQKFKGIGPGNWFEVLATSPAEPGLSGLQPIPANTTREKVLAEMRKTPEQRWQGLEYKRNMLSAGGWSDLHPTGVLKANGCDKVAYLTRKDGETVFGQQVFIRLTGAQDKVPFWEQLRDKNNDGWAVTGSTADTPWNKLYNLGNPNSSFNRALGMADATYCTNWNAYDMFKGEMWPLVKDAYNAPVFLRSGTPQDFRVNATTADASKFPGCAPKTRPLGGTDSPPASVDPAL